MRAQIVWFTATAVAALVTVGAGAQSPTPMSDKAGHKASQVITEWKATPREVAQKMIGKYGEPNEVTANRLIWHNNGPWKITELVNEEIPHDFPVPHKDMLYQAIGYRIDPEKATALLSYDGSVILERTKGLIAARCDKEEMNFLAVNLANDVATGKKSVGDARRFYAESAMAMMKENKVGEYLKGFQFKVPSGDQGDRDKPFGPMGTSMKQQ